MPATSDWRSTRREVELKRLQRPHIGLEFLRRSRTYRTDYSQMLERIAAGTVSRERAFADFAQRWGLVVPFRPGNCCRRCADPVAPGTRASGRAACTCAKRIRCCAHRGSRGRTTSKDS
ncbi:DUF6499 domain-containing protein [uncultured Reyranella sp.]|uniref:transcriptional regulator domain-containing protein n=1 Tax=uncultured Reyranella sp. TaxID=735512 RepID=UPI00338E4069